MMILAVIRSDNVNMVLRYVRSDDVQLFLLYKVSASCEPTTEQLTVHKTLTTLQLDSDIN